MGVKETLGLGPWATTPSDKTLNNTYNNSPIGSPHPSSSLTKLGSSIFMHSCGLQQETNLLNLPTYSQKGIKVVCKRT